MTDLPRRIKQLFIMSIMNKILIVNIDDLHNILRAFIGEGYTVQRERPLAIWQVRARSIRPLFEIYVDVNRVCPRGQYFMIDAPSWELSFPEIQYDFLFGTTYTFQRAMNRDNPSGFYFWGILP